MAARFTGYRESQTQRSALPVPHALPFLLIGAQLVAPWAKARVLSSKQAGELRQVLAVLLARAGDLPRLAWVTVIGEVTIIPEAEPSWLARKKHDGYLIQLGSPERHSEGRISPDGSRVFRELAAGWISAGLAAQP